MPCDHDISARSHPGLTLQQRGNIISRMGDCFNLQPVANKDKVSQVPTSKRHKEVSQYNLDQYKKPDIIPRSITSLSNNSTQFTFTPNEPLTKHIRFLVFSKDETSNKINLRNYSYMAGEKLETAFNMSEMGFG